MIKSLLKRYITRVRVIPNLKIFSSKLNRNAILPNRWSHQGEILIKTWRKHPWFISNKILYLGVKTRSNRVLNVKHIRDGLRQPIIIPKINRWSTTYNPVTRSRNRAMMLLQRWPNGRFNISSNMHLVSQESSSHKLSRLRIRKQKIPTQLQHCCRIRRPERSNSQTPSSIGTQTFFQTIVTVFRVLISPDQMKFLIHQSTVLRRKIGQESTWKLYNSIPSVVWILPRVVNPK